MNFSLWFLPLICGYYFLSRYVYKKYKYSRLETQRLVFDSFIYGAFIFIVIYFFRIIVELVFPEIIPKLYKNLYKLPIENHSLLWTLILNFLIVVFGVKILNVILKRFDYFNFQTPVEKAVDKFGDELELLFKRAAKEENLLQVTLKNNKVYVGFVEYIPPPKESNYLKIIPLISGFRNNDTKELEFTTDYYNAILLYQSEESKYDNFQMDITLKQDEILTANIFDFDVYKAFYKNENLSKT